MSNIQVTNIKNLFGTKTVAITSTSGDLVVRHNLSVDKGVNAVGVVTAQKFVGDGSGLANLSAVIAGGIELRDDDTLVGTSGTISFNGGGVSAITVNSGIASITIPGIPGINTTGDSVFTNIDISGNAGIGSLNVSGVSTFVGLSTFNDGIIVLSGISTFTDKIDANGDLDVDGHTELDNLRVSGVSTLRITTLTDVTAQQLNVSGVSTLGITTLTDVTAQQLNVSGISTLGITTLTDVTAQQLNVSGVSTLGVTTATDVTLQQLNVSGVSTLGITTLTDVTAQQLNVSGVSTLGITTLTDVTAQQLNVSGILTSLSGIKGIGIQSGGVSIATGIITALNFIGVGNTIVVRGTSVDISIRGAGGIKTDADRNHYGNDSNASSFNGAVDNVLFGHEAGSNITTGDSNVIIGSNAGDNLTTGTQNTFIGHESGGHDGTGSDETSNNTAIGYRALYNDHGSGNTAVGSGAGELTGGSSVNNVFVGLDAGNRVNGNANVAIGKGAIGGSSATGGSSNVCIGPAAGNALTGTASNQNGRNNLMGSETGKNITTGDDNTFIGHAAGVDVTTGDSNTFIGSRSGGNFTGASDTNNVAVGRSSGAGVSGSNNTIIGCLEYPDSTVMNGQVAIGAGVTEFVRINETGLGIGTDNPGTKLEVAGIVSATSFNFNSNNVKIGYKAGESLTTGVDNVYIGYRAGDSNTNDSQNIAIGSYALDGVAGDANIAIGYNAARSAHFNADRNILIGYSAGYYVSGDTNIALGHEALGSSFETGGGGNIAIGYRAAYNLKGTTSLLDANGNIIMGSNAGYSIETGGNNIFLGGKSGYDINGGDNNTFLGNQSGVGITNTSSRNVAIGYSAGVGIRTAHDCTIIGGLLYPDDTIMNGQVAIGAGVTEFVRINETGLGIGTDVPNSEVASDNNNILNVGIVTAREYYGDGSNIVNGRWTLGANGSNDYTFTGIGFTQTTNDPVLYLARGNVYEFVNNSGGSHPFQIRVSNGGAAYSDGVTNNGSSNGTIKFEVPFNAPNTLYYQCTSHVSMGNTINVYPTTP